MAGRVVGMNTLVRSSPFGGAADGIAYAIPASTIQAVARDLMDGVVNRGFLGVVLEELGEGEAKALGLPSTNGALVSDVVAGSPAAQAGIRRGDVILKVNGQAVRDNQDCLRKIALLRPGQTAALEIWRNSKAIVVNVTIAVRTVSVEPGDIKDASHQVTMSTMGIEVQTLTDVVAAKLGQAFAGQGGVVISNVRADSEAAKLGLRPGDVILAVGERDVASLSDVNLAVEQARAMKREYVLLYVQTQLGTKAHAALPVDAK
jgi:serine protease Do